VVGQWRDALDRGWSIVESCAFARVSLMAMRRLHMIRLEICMSRYDVFNGDADGLCALHQLRLIEPLDTRLVTGPKREIDLLGRVPVGEAESVTVLDLSMEKNGAALRALLEAGVRVAYFDHHFPGEIPAHPGLSAHLDTRPEVCTSLLVDAYLDGRARAWAVVGAFGDNLNRSARRAAESLGLDALEVERLRELGICLNYNGYGPGIEDLHFAPDALYRRLQPYADPFDFIREEAAFAHLRSLEFRRMFSGEMDANNAFLDIQAGSGGTEAQDWAEMLLRMYLRWGERRGFKTELIEVSAGEVAGIKSATVKFEGDMPSAGCAPRPACTGWCASRPFDSGNRRHTSFAAVFVSPEVDDSVEIEINPADLRIDTYRASGAGGQHVNRTESAVRITHNPTGIVVQCQNDRSQHKNRDQAMKQLKSKLYELEMQKRRASQQALEETKSDIGWGSQIRSYVLDQSRIKDLRTGVEIGNTQAVLDGDLDPFIEASLKSGL
jgi:peptide chain release factor 2